MFVKNVTARTPKTYADNAYNRSHERAGLPMGSAVISKSSSSGGSRADGNQSGILFIFFLSKLILQVSFSSFCSFDANNNVNFSIQFFLSLSFIWPKIIRLLFIPLFSRMITIALIFMFYVFKKSVLFVSISHDCFRCLIYDNASRKSVLLL